MTNDDASVRMLMVTHRHLSRTVLSCISALLSNVFEVGDDRETIRRPTFFNVLSESKTHDFLRFFELLQTFSRTLDDAGTCTSGNGGDSRNCLEHFARPCPVITFYCNLSPAAEDILVSTVISRHHHLTLLTMLPWTL